MSVLCPPIARHPKDDATVQNPRVLVEVLSDATEACDRGAKFSHYRAIPSLVTYVLVSQREPRVDCYERSDAGWVLRDAVGEGSSISLASLGVTLALADLYASLPD